MCFTISFISFFLFSFYSLSVIADSAESGTCNEDVVRSSSLSDVLDNSKLKFIFVGGKGGVGKTTVSSALAARLAVKRHATGGGNVLLISTDPAHSLSDAFKIKFDGIPRKVSGVDGLEVMEIDPKEILKSEINQWAKLAGEAGLELVTEVNKFQNWLTTIPGIDEATALSTVIDYIQKGQYSTIVFDTAPTGHTLKLLQLPETLQIGITQLQGWQTKLWSYYDTFSNLMSLGKKKKTDTNTLRIKLQNKIQNYKDNIEKVAKVLKDNSHTTFISVCIAEYLSISETQRLLQELHEHKIHTSHLVVNQLVNDAPSNEELDKLDVILSESDQDVQFKEKMKQSLRLVMARQQIQSKYLNMLRNLDETKCITIVQIPLLPWEVTGYEKLLQFSDLLVNSDNVNKNSDNKDEL